MTEYDLIIVGGGPIGLACAIEAQKKNLNYLIIEKGAIVNSIFNYPLYMTFFSTAERLEIGDIPFDVGRIETYAMNSDHTISDAMNSDHTNSDIELGAINSDHNNSNVCISRRSVDMTKPQKWIWLRSKSYLNHMLTSELISTFLHLKNYLWSNWSPKSLSKPTTVFAGQHESASNQLTTSLT